MTKDKTSVTSSTSSFKLPPGPAEKVTLDELRNDALKFLLHFTRIYGDIVYYRTELWSVILVNRPDYIKHVLQDNHQNYTKEGTPDLMMLKPMLGEGLMTSEGESWFQQRRIAQPAFHRERIDAFGTAIADATLALLDKWQSFADQGQPLEIAEEMAHLTLQIVARILFGVDISNDAGNFAQAVGVMNQYMAHFDYHDKDRLLQFQTALSTINGLVRGIILKRRQQNKDTGDLLSMLMLAEDENTGERMSDRLLQSQVFTLLMAGHETTAKALTWTLYLLDQHPIVARKLQKELATVLGGRIPTCQDLPTLPYTWMVIQEAMRLYPPVWSMSRLCCVDDEIGGYHIPAKSLVLVSPYAMHRHPDFWEEPEQFNPERFTQEAASRRSAYAYMPFSGGPRQCIGQTLATVETRLVLATIAQRYQLRLVSGHTVKPEALVTLRPQFGLPMTLHRLMTFQLATGAKT